MCVQDDNGGGQVVDCKHIKHAINPGQVIRGVKDNELGVCEVSGIRYTIMTTASIFLK